MEIWETPQWRKEHKIPPYHNDNGDFINGQLAWGGYCSACGKETGLRASFSYPDIALMLYAGSYPAVENSFVDEHLPTCEEGAEFIPTSAEDFYYDTFNLPRNYHAGRTRDKSKTASQTDVLSTRWNDWKKRLSSRYLWEESYPSGLASGERQYGTGLYSLESPYLLQMWISIC